MESRHTTSHPAAHSPLSGRVAVVTGATSGLGAATARRLVADGASVALVGRRADRLRALSGELGEDVSLGVPADVTDPATLGEAAARTLARFGRVDLVVANAGIMLPGATDALRVEEWRRMVDVNLVGVLETVRAFLPALLEAAAEADVADLFLVSSLGARAIFDGYAVYGATKAATSYLGQAWRSELAPRGVRVTVLEPGLTHSELAGNVTDRDHAEALAGMFEAMPALEAEDIAGVLSYAAALPARASLPNVPILPSRQV